MTQSLFLGLIICQIKVCFFFLFFGRYYVLYRLPALNFLDSRRVKAAEKEEAKRVGAHMKIIAPSSEDLVSKGTHKNIHSLCVC